MRQTPADKKVTTLLAILLGVSVVALTLSLWLNATLIGIAFGNRTGWADREIHLPDEDRPRSLAAPPAHLIVNISENGRYKVGGKEVSEEQLRRIIREALAKDPQRNVLVRNASGAQMDRVTRVLAICGELGVPPDKVGYVLPSDGEQSHDEGMKE